MRTYKYKIGGQKIIIIDNVLSANETQKIQFYISQFPLSRIGTTKIKNLNTQHYVCRDSLKEIHRFSAFKKLATLIKKHSGHKNAICERVTYREIVYGDHFEYHSDTKRPGHLTAVIYLNEEWNINNRGETLFLDKNDIGMNVLPRHGRIILFDSRLKHTSSAPSRTFFGARKILVFNFKLQKL